MNFELNENDIAAVLIALELMIDRSTKARKLTEVAQMVTMLDQTIKLASDARDKIAVTVMLRSKPADDDVLAGIDAAASATIAADDAIRTDLDPVGYRVGTLHPSCEDNL